MHFTTSTIIALSIATASVTAKPFKFPLPDGFPNPRPAQLAILEKETGGSPPNGPLPTALKSAGITTLQLLATNELFEVAYFSELLANVSNNVPGYTRECIAPLHKKYVVDALTAVVNQEKLHAAGVNGILTSAKQPAIKPCSYQFPVSDFLSAITLAQTFTDVVLGTLPSAQVAFGTDGAQESALVPLIGSVLAQEGEQNGFYRSVQKKTPSAAPFLTGSSASFAFTAIQSFIVPNSCPQPLSNINLTTFKPLTVLTKTPKPTSTSLDFSVPSKIAIDTHSLVYLSGQNVPLTIPITAVVSPSAGASGPYTFTAKFPFESGHFANGLTIAAVVKGTGKNYTSNDAVAADTVFGPGLIEVN